MYLLWLPAISGEYSLGVSGLIIAYRTAAASAIQNSHIIERQLREYYDLSFSYPSMNVVMKILKEEGAGQSDQQFGTACRMMVDFRLSAKERILGRLSRVEGAIFSYRETR
jgi:putative IMPACT (imprinted ancient) family translation regulator